MEEIQKKHISTWLICCCIMILIMVLIGGFTRLTHSGLSMVEWKPVTGFIPPLSEEAWQTQFNNYRESPEYKLVNKGMDLSAFKRIFWVEFIHRVAGRLTGLVFFVPFLFFIIRRYLPFREIIQFSGIFLLGALQGVAGWYMVKSGLVKDPDVSHYRLTLHLMLAFTLFGLVCWKLYSYLSPPSTHSEETPPRLRHLSYLGWTLLVCVILQVSLGGMVAGTNAGLVYNEFPTMGGKWVPTEWMHLTPWYHDVLENPVTLQYLHRVGALLTVSLTLLFFFLIRRNKHIAPLSAIHSASLVMLGIVLFQTALGVGTLLYHVPLIPALLHQFVAFLLLAALLLVIQRITQLQTTDNEQIIPSANSYSIKKRREQSATL